jgi:hypothetical protein
MTFTLLNNERQAFTADDTNFLTITSQTASAINFNVLQSYYGPLVTPASINFQLRVVNDDDHAIPYDYSTTYHQVQINVISATESVTMTE